MEYYNNILAVQAKDIIASGIMTKAHYDQLVYRGELEVIRRGCRNTPALVAFDNIPDRFKMEIPTKLGRNYEIAKQNQLEQRIMHNAETAMFFENYTLADGRHLKAETRREYYSNAVILDAIHRLLNDKKPKHRSLGHRAKMSWNQISKDVEDVDRSKFPHSLPANPRRLEDKYKNYIKEGFESIIHKGFLNKSAAKINDDVKESFIIELLSDPRNLDNEQVRSLYNIISDKMRWKPITGSAVAVWRDKLETITHAGRRGSTSFSNEKAMQAKRKAPTQPLYYITLDGWDVALLYQKFENGRTTYHHKPTVVIILDACIKYPLGFAVGTHETPTLIKAALRDAHRHMSQIFGAMYRAHQIQSDHYAISVMSPLYGASADKVTPARVKNSKSKVIEPYFKQINKRYCQLMPNWSGFGITSNKESQPNIEFLNKYRTEFPDYDGVCKQVEMIINQERRKKIERYLELWNKMPETDKILMGRESYLLNYGESTGYTYMLNGSGIQPTINGVKVDYDCFEPAFRKHSSTRWEIRFDPEDLSTALAVSENQELRFMLEEKYVQPMALKDRKDGDYEQLERVRNFNKVLEAEITETRAISGSIVRDTIERNPELETLKKLLLVDSHGQHKNQLSAAKKALPGKAATADDDNFLNMY